jgi:hypothetical protein
MRIPVLLAVAAICGAVLGTAVTPVHGGSGPALRFDLNVDNNGGPCASIEDEAEIGAGQTLRIAVCFDESPTLPLAAFRFRVLYDDTVVIAPEVADEGPALDDNPDANAGSTTFSDPDLGGGWDCSGGVGSFPMGDEDGAPGNGQGSAYSGGCGGIPGPNRLMRGPLAVIEFRGVGPGETTLRFSQASVTDDSPAEVGSCEPSADIPMDCSTATVRVSGEAPTPTPESGETVIVEITQCAGPEGSCTPVVVTAVATQPPGGNGGGNGGGDGGGDGDGEDGDDGDATVAPAERTRTALATRTAGTGTIDEDSDDHGGGGSNSVWIIVGVVAVLAVAAGGVGYWGYSTRGWFRS